MKKYVLAALVLTLLLVIPIVMSIPATVRVQGGIQFYDGVCTINSTCTTNYCLDGRCACLADTDCDTSEECTNGTCIGRITTSETIYHSCNPIDLTGRNFTEGNVTLQFYNASDILVSTTTVNANSTGGFIASIATTSFDAGTHTIEAIDASDADINGSVTVTIANDYTFSGSVEWRNDSAVPFTARFHNNQSTLITQSSDSYNITLNYCDNYDINISVPSTNITAVFSNITNVGNLDTIFIVDDPPENVSDLPFVSLVAFDPVITRFDTLDITLTHGNATEWAIYKCPSWNMSGQTCTDDDWEVVIRPVDGTTSTTFTLSPGDPGVGVGPHCGDGACNMGEGCSSCPADCSCSSGSSGGGSSSTTTTTTTTNTTNTTVPEARICEESWICEDWGECIDGYQERDCNDKNKCWSIYNKPLIRTECTIINKRTQDVVLEPPQTEDVEGLPRITGRAVANIKPANVAAVISIITFALFIVLVFKKRISLTEKLKKIRFKKTSTKETIDEENK